MSGYALTRRWHRGLAAALDVLGAAALGWRRRPLPPRGRVRRLLLIRLERFGDLILLLPALARARTLFPRAQCTLLTRPEYRGFLAVAVPELDLWCVSGWRDALRRRRPRFDLALEFHGDPRRILLGRRHARRLAGYGVRGGGFLLDLPVAYPARLAAARRQGALVEAAAGERADSWDWRPRLALAPAWAAAAAPLLRTFPADFIVLHPGCGQSAKRWPAPRWRALLARCRAQGWSVALTGSAADRELCSALAMNGGGARNLAGTTDWNALAGVVAAARAVVAPDTGVIHLARALGTPTVALYGPNPPAVWGAAGQPGHRDLVHPLPCSFCDRGRCPRPEAATAGYSPCMEAISPEAAWGALAEILGVGAMQPGRPSPTPADFAAPRQRARRA